MVRKAGRLLFALSCSPEEESQPIGVWGQRHARYLNEHRKVLYRNLLASGKLNAHLAEIDKTAEDMFFRVVKEMAEKQGVTEQLKATLSVRADIPMQLMSLSSNCQRQRKRKYA